MITARHLTKNYGPVAALKEVSFEVAEGEIIGLLGPNGAGKTTLMKILTGYIHPSAGTATVAGHDVLAEPRKVQAEIGYLPENAPLYPELTVQGSLRLMAELRGIPRAEQFQAISDAVRATGLADRLTRPVGTLSKGYRQRVGLAQAILHRPRVLILDEPTNGLDPRQIVEVRQLIKELAKDSTVIVSSHILSEIEATCDRVLIIIDGELRTDARLADLAATGNLLVRFAGQEHGRYVEGIKGLAGVAGVRIAGRDDRSVSLRVTAADGRDLGPPLFRLACDNGWPLAELRQETRTLETVFNEVTAAAGGIQ